MKSTVDQRNRLNDLTNKEWLQQTKSFWMSQAPPRDELKLQHPATFSERDIERLIGLFTKPGQTVLDPFVGVGSTLIACLRTGRRGIGIELVRRWIEVAEQRLAAESGNGPCEQITIIPGDAAAKLAELDPESIDFVVTSPPYWRILSKKAGMKVTAERTSRSLPTNYSDDGQNLADIEDYGEFLTKLGGIFAQCAQVLRGKQYMAVIVSDFRHGPRYYLYHADLARTIEQQTGMVLKGVIALLQDSKNLYAYGIPYAYVPNIHHQQILILQKPDSD